MMIRQTLHAGSHLGQPRPLPQRHDAWHRDERASAFAIARWEDDGGLVEPCAHRETSHSQRMEGRRRTAVGIFDDPDGRRRPSVV